MWRLTLAAVALLGFGALNAQPRGRLSAAETTAAVRRMMWSSAPGALENVRMRAVETWTETGRPEAVSTETDEVSFYHGVPLELQLTRNDLPLARGAEKKQAAGLRRMQARVEAAEAAAPDSDGRLLNLNGEVWTLARFAAGFDWTGEAGEQGRIELSFTPAAASARPLTRLARILSRMAGRLEVDAASGQVLGGEFHSTGPVNFGGGLLAHFSDFHGHFSMQPAAGTWVMKEAVVSVEGRELFHRIHGTETMIYTVESAK